MLLMLLANIIHDAALRCAPYATFDAAATERDNIDISVAAERYD